ncbi:MAG: hypothetical protein HY894_09320 [Deltaproteobacteria bacterium]|nr:hypothetical protein [Deltaproteobacteria bacterium]
MRKFQVLAAAFFFFCLALLAAAEAREPLAEDAEGTAIKSDAYDVRKKATDDALRNAVVAAVDALRKEGGAKTGADAASNLYANASTYVLTYKILSEGWMTHFDIAPEYAEPAPGAADRAGADAASTGVEVYHVRVRASVDAGTLANALVSLKGGGASTASAITVTLLDMPDYAAFNAVIAALEAAPEIKDIGYNSLYRGRIALTASVTSTDAALAGRLSKDLGEGFAVSAAPDGNVRGQAPAHNITIKPASARAGARQ